MPYSCYIARTYLTPLRLRTELSSCLGKNINRREDLPYRRANCRSFERSFHRLEEGLEWGGVTWAYK